MSAPITAIYAALCGLLLLGLAALVVRARRKYRTSLGVGTEPGMERAVRVHANFVEYVPLALLLLLLAEINGARGVIVHACGILLLVSRGLHAYGLSGTSGRSFGRFWGTAGTWTVLLALALVLLAGAAR
ncbi:MAG: yecN [Proteobacteria bacterium]|nr:yecN [Pseudomonadota bacterium]